MGDAFLMSEVPLQNPLSSLPEALISFVRATMLFLSPERCEWVCMVKPFERLTLHLTPLTLYPKTETLNPNTKH